MVVWTCLQSQEKGDGVQRGAAVGLMDLGTGLTQGMTWCVVRCPFNVIEFCALFIKKGKFIRTRFS